MVEAQIRRRRIVLAKGKNRIPHIPSSAISNIYTPLKKSKMCAVCSWKSYSNHAV